MKSVTSIVELKSILNHLSSRELRSAEKYFTRFYSESKEYQLFRALESFSSDSEAEFQELAKELGYESIRSGPFQKLKSRLKQKLIDFLMSDFAAHGGSRDAFHSLKVRLKKLNLQACIMNEKGFPEKARELHMTAFRMAEQFQHYNEAVVSLKDYLSEVNEPLASTEYSNAYRELNRYGFLNQLSSSFLNDLKQIQLKMDLQTLENPTRDLERFIEDISHASPLKNSQACELMQDLATIWHRQVTNHSNLTISTCYSWLERIESEPAIFDRFLSSGLKRSFLETLLIVQHHQPLAIFIERRTSETPLDEMEFELLRLIIHVRILKWESELSGLIPAMKSKIRDRGQRQLYNYYNAHNLFIQQDVRPALNQINEHIRSFPTSSIQQLDLMVLELICLYELGNKELILYRIQAFAKNLSYRRKYSVPQFYSEVRKFFQCVHRSDGDFKNINVRQQVKRVLESKPDPLVLPRSVNPSFFNKWIRDRHFNLELQLN